MTGDLRGIIIEGVAGSYHVSTKEGVFICPARGLFRLQEITPLVGDRVIISTVDREKKTGVVYNILERTNELVRPKVANVDLALITFSVQAPKINWQLLDEMLLQTEKAGIETGIIINKIDLSVDDLEIELKAVYEPLGYPVFLISATKQAGLEPLRKKIQQHTTLFLGPSGVGKSSVINAISDYDLQTGPVSVKTERGKHTTRQTNLLSIGKDTFVVDSPGFTALNMTIGYRELGKYYPEFRPLAPHCKFNNCVHLKETDCAVKDAIGKTVNEKRYLRYTDIVEKAMAVEIRW